VVVDSEDANRDLYGFLILARDVLGGRVSPLDVASLLYKVIGAAGGINGSDILFSTFKAIGELIGVGGWAVFDVEGATDDFFCFLYDPPPHVVHAPPQLSPFFSPPAPAYPRQLFAIIKATHPLLVPSWVVQRDTRSSDTPVVYFGPSLNQHSPAPRWMTCH